MISGLKAVGDANVRRKKVFVRADFDVPLENGEVADETRLVAGVSTIEYLLEEGASVIAAGHLGRPENNDQSLTLEPVAKWFANEFNCTPTKTTVDGTPGWKLKDNFYILENLRFDAGEEANDSNLAHKLAYGVDLYVNEAFASSHRAHASITGLPKLLPHFAGFHFLKEVKILSRLTQDPKRPLVIIVGGAKIETKLPLISRMHKFADYVLVGGELAENDNELARVAHERLNGQKSVLLVADLTGDGKDITEHSIQNFTQVIENSETIIWNGPMGEFEKCFDLGTRQIAQAIVNSKAYTVVGGGDTLGFLSKEGLLPKFSFVSTGGGAMLEFLSGEALPGLIALQS